jgi:hypothetical protein
MMVKTTEAPDTAVMSQTEVTSTVIETATAGIPSANNSRDTNNGGNLSDIRYVISSRTPATAKTPTTEGVIEIEGTPATGLSLSHDSDSYCFFSLTLDGGKIQIQKT